MKNKSFENYEGLNPLLNQPYDFRDKEKCIKFLTKQILNRTCTMFKYENLPNTINYKDLERFLQIHGYVIFAKHNEKLYFFRATLGGEPNEYYLPTQAIISNPFLKLNQTFEIDKNCVWMRNDTFIDGLYPLINKYVTLLIENELTMYLNNVKIRSQILFKGNTNKDVENAKQYLKNMEDGKWGAVASSEFAENIRVENLTTGQNNVTIQLIEMEQYLKATLFNELGLEMNHNMKRETINEAEATLNEDSLLPLIDDMLEERKSGIDKVNKMFGTNISVSLNSAWLNRQETINESGDKDD